MKKEKRPRVKYTRGGLNVLRNGVARIAYGWEAMLVPPVKFLPTPKDGLYSFKKPLLQHEPDPLVWANFLCIDGQWYNRGTYPYCEDWPRLSEKEAQAMRSAYKWLSKDGKYIIRHYDWMMQHRQLTRRMKLYRRRYK